MAQQARLKNFPISWFAVVMGFAGFTIAWDRAETILELPFKISPFFLVVTVIIFCLLSLFYFTKFIKYRPEIVKELNHPVKLSFFATFSISLILLSIALLHKSPEVSKYLWVTGTVLHLFATLYVMSVWITHTKFEIHHINPAWFIPVVGNILIPIAGVHFFSTEISWFFFSIGLVFWLVLLTIIMYRIIFHEPIAERLLPTLFILIAPPAVGFISYMHLIGGVDGFARILYYSGAFLTLLLLTQGKRFYRLKFFLSWWAYSFPMAAITIATLAMYHHTGLEFFYLLAGFLLILLTIIIATLVTKTIAAIIARKICVEETEAK